MSESFLQQKMIFVVGNSRSGTTMMGRVLGNIPNVFTFHELHFFEYLWDPASKKMIGQGEQITLAARLISIERDGYLKQQNIAHYLDEAACVVRNLPDDVSPAIVFAAFLGYETRLHDRIIPCDQTPRNILFLDQILTHFPNAYVINMLRDPRDVLLSQKKKWRRRSLTQNRGIPVFEAVRSWTNYHPITISMLWNANVRAAQKFSVHPRFFQIQYEMFTQDSEVCLKNICSWLSLDYHPDYLQIPRVGSSHGKDSPQARGIKHEKIGHWGSANSRDFADLAICEALCRQNMNALEYPVSHVRANPVSLLLAWMTWPVKTGLALVLNLGRSRNIISSIVRRLKH